MPQPVIEDQYTVARMYFACVVGLFFIESLLYLPPCLLGLRLQGRPSILQRSSHYSRPYTILHKIMTLPSIVPSVTNHHFPNIARFLVISGLNILFGYNRIEYGTDYKLYGWLTIANGGVALLLSTRSNLFSLILRIPNPTLLVYHRFIGFATFVNATLHFALNIRHDIVTKQLVYAITATRIRVGIMAWLSLAIIFVTSLPFVRRRFFELFYYSHFLFFVFVVGALIHTTNGSEFLLPGLSLWVVDRLIRFVYNFRSVEVEEVTWYEGDLTKFKLKGLQARQPGQVVWIQVPGVSWLNWHPFTIASAPGEQATVAVRGLGTFTKKLQLLSDASHGGENNQGGETGTKKLKMRLDGPYGVAGIQWGLYPITLIIAGGIGITPGISIAAHIITLATKLRDTKKESDKQWHIHLLWVVKAACHSEWFKEELKYLSTIAADPTIPLTFSVTIHVTGLMRLPLEAGADSLPSNPEIETQPVGREEVYSAKSFEGQGEMIQGRPDLLGWMESVKRLRPGMDAVVSTCGPRQLLDDSRKAAAKASGSRALYFIDEEVFEL